MKTIVIQLIKSMFLQKEDYRRIGYSGHAMEYYAPVDVYDYFTVGGKNILARLNTTLLTRDLIPMLKELYSEYGDKKYSEQYDAVFQELNRLDTISFDICERLGYANEEEFYPVFINDANSRPFLMYDKGVKIDCTGIILCSIPPEKATLYMLFTLEQEIQNKLCKHPLAKALKVCMMSEP